MKIEDIKRVLIIGSGTMGAQIALQCAISGFEISLYDLTLDLLDTALHRIEDEFGGQMAAAGVLTTTELEAALGRITLTLDPEAAAEGVDLLSESIPEDPGLKGEVFAQFNELCPARAIFTTNTSSLVPSQYARETGRPAQFCALHFHSPVWYANVVDIMPHPGTSHETVALLHDFARKIGQTPIFIEKESPGYVFNAMLDAVLGSALDLAINGVASVEDVDRAWMGITKMPMGPFGIMDLVGIDLVYEIARQKSKGVTFLPQARRLLNFLEAYVNEGKLGVKSGQGFYRYPDPAFEQQGFVEGD